MSACCCSCAPEVACTRSRTFVPHGLLMCVTKLAHQALAQGHILRDSVIQHHWDPEEIQMGGLLYATQPMYTTPGSAQELPLGPACPVSNPCMPKLLEAL